jgi:hypothetical protein
VTIRSLYKLLLRWLLVPLILIILIWSGKAAAHSSSNSYLTIFAPNNQLALRADIHLRDVDLIFDLDSNRDGQVTWGETQMRSSELSAWLEQGLHLSQSGEKCSLGKVDLQVSQLADGTYLSALWAPDCQRINDIANADFTLRYSLIFQQDSLHRGLLKVDLPNLQSSALLSPERPDAQVNRSESSALRVFGKYIIEGVWHIWIGIDHIVFLISLLLLAPLQPARMKIIKWPAAKTARPVLLDVFAVVTAFTIAHSITLCLTVMEWLTPPSDLVEQAIALSVVLASLNNLLGVYSLKRWRLAFVFGLIHGFGFANVLLDLGLPIGALVAALGGFNLGVELGQLVIVLVFLPLAWFMRHTLFYRWVVAAGGSFVIALLGVYWLLVRSGV